MITLSVLGTLDVLLACDACADMGMTYSVIVQCTDCMCVCVCMYSFIKVSDKPQQPEMEKIEKYQRQKVKP